MAFFITPPRIAFYQPDGSAVRLFTLEDARTLGPAPFSCTYADFESIDNRGDYGSEGAVICKKLVGRNGYYRRVAHRFPNAEAAFRAAVDASGFALEHF